MPFTRLLNRRGFTLIEAMIVVAIISILTAIAVPNFRKARERARTAQCIGRLRHLSAAIIMYDNDYDTHPPDLNTLLTIGYVNEALALYCVGKEEEGIQFYDNLNVAFETLDSTVWLLSCEDHDNPPSFPNRAHEFGEAYLVLYIDGNVSIIRD